MFVAFGAEFGLMREGCESEAQEIKRCLEIKAWMEPLWRKHQSNDNAESGLCLGKNKWCNDKQMWRYQFETLAKDYWHKYAENVLQVFYVVFYETITVISYIFDHQTVVKSLKDDTFGQDFSYLWLFV